MSPTLLLDLRLEAGYTFAPFGGATINILYLCCRYTSSTGDMEVVIITYGAAISSIRVPARDGTIDDVVAGYDTVAG